MAKKVKIILNLVFLVCLFSVTQQIVFAQANYIVINEIQVAGISASDEFIELYNPTGVDVNLIGWRLSKKTKSGNEYNLLTTFPDVIIPSNGYLIVAHTDYIGSADLNYSTSQSLASNNTLILYSDSGDTVVDLVGWGEATIFEGSGGATDPAASESLSRQGSDTDDNARDFIATSPTPGLSNDLNPSFQPVPLYEDEDQADEAPQTTDSQQPTTDDAQQTSSFATTGQIIINELLPNPEGLDSKGEWIELKNIDNQTIDLSNWSISDKSRSYIIDSDDFTNTLINPGGFLIITRQVTNIALNNTGGETITLKDVQKNIIDSVDYSGNTPEAQTWARNETGNWEWTTTLTQGSENVITQESQEHKNTENTSSVISSEVERSQTTEEFKNSRTEGQIENLSNQDYSSLIINELFPNPEGKDEEGEWIELYNKGKEIIDLQGIKIGDSSEKVYEIENGIIEPEKYFLIPRTLSKIALNNNGDSVKLWSPDGILIISTRYFGKADSGESYALTNSGLWDWTIQPTPKAKNVFSRVLGIESAEDEIISNRPASSQKRTIKPKFLNTNTVSLNEIRSLKIGDKATTQGIVSAEPNLFGKTYFYIANNDAGIRIYSANKEFPDLKLGDLIEVSGTLSQSNEEIRLKISSIDDIKFIEHTIQPEPIEAELSEINETLEGSLVLISGEVTSIKSANIYLNDMETEARVYLAGNTDIDPSIYRTGDKLQITGIVSQTKVGYRIMPRSQDDIILITEQIAGAQTENILIKNRTNNINPIVYIILLAVAGVVISLIILNRKFHWLKSFQNKKDSNIEKGIK